MLSILSLNTNHGKHLPDFLSYLDNNKADYSILCFQEFPKDFLPQLNNYICTKGKRYTYATYRTTKEGLQYGNLTVISNPKIEITNEEVINLKSGFVDNVIRPKVWGTKINICAIMQNLKFDGIDFVLFNTQLTAFSNNYTRFNQLKVMANKAKAFKKVFIVGDLNTPNFDINCLSELSLFKNNTSNLQSYNFHGIKYQTDYILSKNFTCLKSYLLETKQNFSDHKAIVGYFKVLE